MKTVDEILTEAKGDIPWGLRKTSIKGMISSRLSPSRFIAHSLGVKMPRGYGWIRNPKKWLRNKIYRKTTAATSGAVKRVLGF